MSPFSSSKRLLLCRCDIPHGDQIYIARGLSIGRAPDNTFVIDDASVARHHCQVEFDAAGGLVLRCVDPGAELTHQGQCVGQLALAAGLRFRVGSAEFECRPADNSASPRPKWVAQCPFCRTSSLPPPAPDVQRCSTCGGEVLVFQTRGAAVACVAAASGSVKLLRLAGEGGMGVVFEGQVVQTGQRVAVKLLNPDLAADKDTAKRFQHEIEILCRLKHPRLVRIVDFGKWNGHPALITEWLPGGNLAQVLQAQRRTAQPLPFPLAAAWLSDACQGLAAIHGAGLVHRDIKPSNLLLAPQGNLKIADLGLAKAVGIETSVVTATGLAIGTPQYMAPEQWTRPDAVDARADIYALGVTFYELLTGRVPVGAWQPASALNPTVPAWFDALLQKMLAPEVEDRLSSVTAVANALALQGAPVAPPERPPPSPAAPTASDTPKVGPAASPSPAESRPLRRLARLILKFIYLVYRGCVTLVGPGGIVSLWNGSPRPPCALQAQYVAYSPDGRRIVTASLDNTAIVWDASTGQRLLVLQGHSFWVVSAAYSPDGRRIVTASWDKTAIVWDAVRGERNMVIKVNH